MADDALERFEQQMQAEAQDRSSNSGRGSKKDGSGLVASLVQQLSGALVYGADIGNAEVNRRLWDRYAENWDPQTEVRGQNSRRVARPPPTFHMTQSHPPQPQPSPRPPPKLQFVKTMAGHTARTSKQPPAAPDASTPTPTIPSPPSVLGEEWSSVADLEDVLTRYLFPCLRPDARAAEIGVGGGRVARYVRRRCARLTCMDLSPKMLQRAKATLEAEAEPAEAGGAGGAGGAAALEFVLLDPRAPAAYPERLAGALDVVYSFDVLVHSDLHTMFAVFQGARRLLKPGGRAFFSTANLLTPAGWRRFERQSKYTAAGFYCECTRMGRGVG